MLESDDDKATVDDACANTPRRREAGVLAAHLGARAVHMGLIARPAPKWLTPYCFSHKRSLCGIDLGRDGAGGLGLTAAYEQKEPGKGEKSLFHGAT